MNAPAHGRLPAEAGSWAAVALVVLLGWATLVALGSAATGRLELAAWTGAAVAAGLVLLLAAGWPHARVLVLLAVTLPLPALHSSESLRIAPPLLLTGVVLTAWCLRHAPDPRGVDLRALPRRSMTWWLGAVALAALFATSTVAAIRELVSLTLLLGLLVVATHELTARPERRRGLATAFAWVAGLAGAAGLLQALGALPTPFTVTGTGFGRATLGFEWPNEAAMFLAILFPFTVHAFVGARGAARRTLAGVGVAATVAGLAATFSRGSWLATLAAPAVLLLLGEWRFVARVWLGVIVAALVVDVASGGAITSRVAMTARDPLVGQRAVLMLTGLIMFADNPVLGLGPGGFADNLDAYGTQVGFLWDFVGSAHNTYIQMAAETGLFGLLAFLVFLGTVGRILLRRARSEHRQEGPAGGRRAGLARAVLWSFATVCLVSMVEWSLTQGIGQLVVLTMALGLAEGA